MKAWEQFKNLQAQEMGQEIVNRWLSTLQVTRFDACNLHLKAISPFQVSWFEEHIRNKLDRCFVNENNKRIKVHLSLTQTDAPIEKKQKTQAQKIVLDFDPIDKNFSLSSFRFTEENALIEKMFLEIKTCKTLKKEVLDLNPKERFAFNPIYLYGPKGTGKTHLLQATAKSLQEQGVEALYVTAKTFTEHVVSAIRASEMGLFREAYRTIDVLLIDNVEEFSRKTATQEELFHTFNALHLRGKLIILASNTLPHHLQNIEPRLVSRFEWGVVLVLKPLPKKSIEELLEELAKKLQFQIRPQVKDFLLSHFTSHSTASLQALHLLAVRVQSSLKPISSTQLSVESVKLLLKDLLEEQEKKVLSAEKIIKAVAEQYGVTPSDLTGRSQTRESALPRQIAMHILRNALHLPFTSIGDIFKRDHSTVMAGVKRIQTLLEQKQPYLLSNYRQIQLTLRIHILK